MQAGRFPAFLNNPYFTLTDQIPQQYNTQALAATQAATTAALTLVTVCPGGAVVSTSQNRQCVAQVPVIPFTAGTGFPNQGTAVTALAIDFGYMVGSTTAGSKTVSSIPDASQLWVGEWVVIGGAGSADNKLPLITQVQTITSTVLGSGTITVSPVPTGSLAAAPIGSANFAGPFPVQGVATAVNPYWEVGAVACLNPTETLARGVSVTSSGGATATTCTVKGYDIYGMAMSEAITVSAGGTAYGKKAFKYVASATLNASDSGHNYSVGVSDVFGLHCRSDKWEYLNTFWNGAFNTSNTGWTAADQTSPATTTRGDVRGTVQVSAIGGGSGYGSTSSNGSIRFATMMSIPLFNLTQSTPVFTTPMFGVTQA